MRTRQVFIISAAIPAGVFFPGETESSFVKFSDDLGGSAHSFDTSTTDFTEGAENALSAGDSAGIAVISAMCDVEQEGAENLKVAVFFTTKNTVEITQEKLPLKIKSKNVHNSADFVKHKSKGAYNGSANRS